MLKATLTLLTLFLAYLNPAFAASPSTCHQALIGSYGIQEMPRNAALMAQLAEAGTAADVVASYDGFPFLVTHYYLRPAFNENPELLSSQQPKASLPKQQPLFRVIHTANNEWLLHDISNLDFVSLNATDERDLTQVQLSPPQRPLTLGENITAQGCFLQYGEATYEPRYLVYFDTSQLNPTALSQFTHWINQSNTTSFSPQQIRQKRYFLVGNISTSALGGELPFSDMALILPVDKVN